MTGEPMWEEPPPLPTKGKWAVLLAPLMEHPKRWARVADLPTAGKAASAAKSLKHGYVIIPPGPWEFAARGNALYARYLGLEDAS